jgi:uncharacterized membrane protein
MLLAVVLYGFMDALIKIAAGRYPVIEIVFFRSLFALLPLALLVMRGGGWRSLATRQPRLQALRAVVGFTSLVCFFDAFALLPLADVVAIGFAAPMFITALSVPLLGEQVGWRRWTAVLVGFLGVLIMVRPGSGLVELGALVALAGTLSYAVSIIIIRRLSTTDSSAPTVASFTLLSVVGAGAVLPFYWVAPTPEDWVLLVATRLHPRLRARPAGHRRPVRLCQHAAGDGARLPHLGRDSDRLGLGRRGAGHRQRALYRLSRSHPARGLIHVSAGVVRCPARPRGPARHRRRRDLAPARPGRDLDDRYDQGTDPDRAAAGPGAARGRARDPAGPRGGL